MKSLLLKSVFMIFTSFLIISALANSSESVKVTKDTQNPDMPMNCSYNSSYSNSSIKFEGTSRIVQAPAMISVGRGYYSAHPISYGSEIGSQTSVKNGRSAVSMQQDISYAHGINSQMDVAAADSSYNFDGSEYRGSTATRMKVDEDVIDGRVHIGVLQGSDDSGQDAGAGGTTDTDARSSANAWRKPALEINEDYIGTYHISKNITLETSYSQDKREESWLDCCNEGYLNIYWPDKIFANADDVFNCKAADPWKILKDKDS